MPDRPLTPPDPPPDRRSPFEWALAGMRPADADVGRPSFMYNAGQASREKAVRLWRWVAAGLVVLLVVGGVAAVGMVTAERQRAEALVAEARAAHHAAISQPKVVAPHPPTSLPVEPADDRPPRTATPLAVANPTDEPTPAEIAAALERRRNILVGGLGLIPDHRPPSAVPPEWSQPLTSGVFAVPPVKQKPADDAPSPPEPR
jgi:hypothetical protein